MRRVPTRAGLRLPAAPTGFVALALALGCKSEASRACTAQFASAQAVVMKIEPEDLASVTGSVSAVELAIETCASAGERAEAEELGKARDQLAGHRDRLVRRAEMLARRRETSPEELAMLVESGDPKCPRGQGYLHQKSGKRIVCVGPQPVDMDRARAEEYFRGRGYKQLPGRSAAELRFEYGAELLVFAYEDEAGATTPRCVTLYPPPDRSWQEVVARLTGVAPARLRPNQPIRRETGALGFALEEGPEKVIARIGNACQS